MDAQHSGEVTGLGSARQFAAGMSAAFAGQSEHTGEFVELLRARGVDGAVVTAAEDAQRASDTAAAAWALADQALTAHKQVGEAYAASPGAGSKEFIVDAAAAPAPMPADASQPASADRLADVVADITPAAVRTSLPGGLAADTQLVTLPDGRRAVHKRGRHDDPAWTRRQADAEILTATVAEAVDARVAEVMRDPSDPDAVYLEYVDGPPPARQAGVGSSRELNEHPDAVRLGLLDALTGNADRQAIMAAAGPVGIDHEQNWPSGATGPWDLPSTAGQPAQAFADEDGFKPGPIPREDLEALQPRLEALRPEFDALGRGAWHDYTMNAHAQLCDRAVPASRPALPEPPLRGDAALDAPALGLDAMTAAGDPRAESLWFRTGDNSMTSGYGEPGCFVLERHLRDPYRTPGQYPELDKVAEDIDAAMADSTLTRPIEVYRGLDLYGLIDAAPGQWRGRAFHDPAPAQVSTDPAAAARHGTVVTVTVPPGVGAIRLAGPAEESGHDLLLQRGLTYQVVDERVQHDDRGRVISHELHVEVVPPRRRPPTDGDGE
ncbi:hypothetical protein ACFFX1_11090 [Dactylosporangium sucinum]|uniref:Uncharacterized protein n=1 Tax=Dactylosporangium sucinum TaxID=1424081 RepID=A0A917TH67_9ACTN|nr:hypothetical protein [Dactylosporangium sucinum]GGM22514.1 hypothetical protein GCM10007977_024590 [Dactylosporangium sucinum]